MRATKEDPHYLSVGRRSFKQALVNLLEMQYKIIERGKVIQMIAEDVKDLAHEFTPLLPPLLQEFSFGSPPLPTRRK